MTNSKANFIILAGLFLVSSAGMARAETDDRAVVRDTDGQIVHITSGTCVRSEGESDQDVCGSRRVVQKMVTEQTVVEEKKTRPISEFTREDRTVYFDFNHSVLLPESSGRLNTLANALKTDQSVKEARIVGYADRIGSVSYNDRLSQKRAETVRDYLIANGYTNARVTETRWVGKSEPSTNCSSAEKRQQLISCLQSDRRVEVEIGLQHADLTPTAQ